MSLQDARSTQLSHMEEILKSIRVDIDAIRRDTSKKSLSAAEIETLTTEVSHLSTSGTTIAKEQAILSSLCYTKRTARHDRIVIAHEKTFNWALVAPGLNQTSDHRLGRGDILHWLGKKKVYSGFQASPVQVNQPS